MTSPDTPILAPPGSGFSMRPAAIVLGLAVVILAVFITIGFLTSTAVQPADSSTRARTVAGTSLRAVPADRVLSVIVTAGEPPSNILNSVAIPEGAVRVSHQNNSAAADQFDEQIGLHSADSQGALNSFYLADMKAQGWQIFATGPADHDPGAIEVLGKKAGSDGFYWEMGAVISTTTFGPHSSATGSTAFTLRLFQVPDPD